MGHRACNVWTEIREVRGATHLQACLELRSDSGIHWSFPETLWSVPIGAWAYGNPLASSGVLVRDALRQHLRVHHTPARLWAAPEQCLRLHHRGALGPQWVADGNGVGQHSALVALAVPAPWAQGHVCELALLQKALQERIIEKEMQFLYCNLRNIEYLKEKG